MKTLSTLLLAFLTISVQAQVIDLPDMNTVRSGHEMVCIADDLIVVFGGSDGSDYLTSVEWFTGLDWVDGEAMNVNRYSFQATLTADGNVLVSGGWDGNTLNHASTALYLPGLDTWEAGPDMAAGRSNHRSILMADGRVLITGGYDGTNDLASCDIIDPSDLSTSVVPDMNTARSSHELVLLPNGKVMAIGGFNPDFDFQMNECEIYDPIANQWSSVVPMSIGRDNFTALGLPDGTVAAIGGRFFDGDLNHFVGQTSTEIYDPGSDSWSAGADLVDGASYNAAYYVPSIDQVIMISGVDATGSGVTTTYSDNQFNEYGPDFWGIGENYLTGDRYRFASCQLPSGNIVVSGGGTSSVQMIGPVDGIEDEAITALNLFPNPARDYVQVGGFQANDRWSVYGLDGTLIQEGRTARIPLGSVAQGVYQVTVSGAGAVSSARLVVH